MLLKRVCLASERLEGRRSLRIDYREMLTEVKELTTIEGFVSACYELKENMMFYDRDLVLAAYGSTVEFWVVATLFCAGLESDQVCLKADKELEKCLQRLTKQLMTEALPLDVQSLAGHFIKGAGWVMLQRYPVYSRMMHFYALGKHQEPVSLDKLLCQVHQCIREKKGEQVTELMGRVGAQLLRGDHIRPIWFRISDARLQMWLSGLQTLVSNFSVSPYFAFPFEDIRAEKQKRARVNGNVVVDLAAVRNFRQDAGGYTDQRISISSDQYDEMITSLLDEDAAVDKALVASSEVKEHLTPVFIAIVEAIGLNREVPITYGKRSLEILVQYQEPIVAKLALNLLNTIEPWDELFQFCLDLLKQLGLKALPEVRKYVRKHKFGSLHIMIADLLSSGPKYKRVTSLLTEIFTMGEWGHGKEIIGVSLVGYLGEEEAKPILEESMANLTEMDRTKYLAFIHDQDQWSKRNREWR